MVSIWVLYFTHHTTCSTYKVDFDIILLLSFYSQSADQAMANASIETGGQAFFAADDSSISSITSALLSTVQAAEGEDDATVTVSRI